MPFPTAGLTAGNYTSLRRNGYKVQQYISLCPNTVIQSSAINQTYFGTVNYAALTLAATVSADAEIGHTVLVSRDATVSAGMDITAIFRIRRTPSSTNLPINETNTRLASLSYYAHIMDDYRIQPKIGRIVGSTYFKDYDWVFTKPRPLINNLQSAYVGFINSGTSKLTISFAPSGLPVAYGATISSWLWDVGDGTITTGTTTTQNITVDFPEGFRWITLTVFDSNGVAGWRRVPVWAHGSTFTPATGFNGATITGDWDNGYSARISGFNGIDKYLDETLCVIWRREWYGDTEEHIVNNVDFVGRLRNETVRAEGSLEHGVLVQDTEFVIEGPGQQLQRTLGPVIATWDATTANPTVWDQIYVNTPGRTLAHILKESTTFAELHDFSWSDKFGDQYRTLAIGTSQSDLLSIVNDIADSCGKGGMEFSPDGASRVAHDGRIAGLSLTAPLAYTSFDDQDTIAINLDIDHVKRYAKVDASGAVYNPSSRTVSPGVSTVPGAVGTTGYNVGSFHRQILQLAGTGVSHPNLQFMAQKYLDLVLNAKFTMSAQLPDGYHFITPSRNIRYDFSLSGDFNARGFNLIGSRFLCTAISIIQDNELGAREVTAEFTELFVAKNEAPEPPDPVFPETPIEIPFDPAGVSQDGNTVVVWSSTGVTIATDFKISDSPLWHDVTPDANGNNPLGVNETVVQCLWALDTPRLYMLSYDSVAVESRVWYKENGVDLYEPFKPGAAVAGEYTMLRATHEDQHIYIYGPNVSANAVTRFSDDSGQTFAAARTVGTGVSGVNGFDTIRIGNTTLAQYNGNSVGISTTEGGTYANYSTPGNFVRAIYIPRYIFGSTTSDNINTGTPEYLVSRSDGATRILYKVTSSGATLTDIAPVNNDFSAPGAVISRGGIVMPWISGNKIAGFFGHNTGSNTFSTTINAGSSWVVTDIVSDVTSAYIRMRRTDALANELYFKLGVTPYYSPDFGVTWLAREVPRGSLIGIEVYG